MIHRLFNGAYIKLKMFIFPVLLGWRVGWKEEGEPICKVKNTKWLIG